MKFCDVDTQDEARELTGCDVFFPRHLADEDEGHLSWAQIVGYTLVDAATGRVVGEIESVDDSTMNLLFQVRTADGDEVLVPAHEELIRNIDTEERRMELELPEGLLDL